MTEQTVAEEIAAENPRTEPIPTDGPDLYQFIVKLPSSERWLVAAWLKAQEDGHDYTDLVDGIIEEICHAENVQAARDELRKTVDDATVAIRTALQLHHSLAGAMYDVEFAEGITASLALGHLKDTERSLATYRAINPDSALTDPNPF